MFVADNRYNRLNPKQYPRSLDILSKIGRLTESMQMTGKRGFRRVSIIIGHKPREYVCLLHIYVKKAYSMTDMSSADPSTINYQPFV